MHCTFCIPRTFNAHALEHPPSLQRESLAHILRFSLSVAVLRVEYISSAWVLLQSFLPYSIPPFHLCSWASPFNGTRFRVYLSASELQLLPVMHKVLTLENSTQSTLRTIIASFCLTGHPANHTHLQSRLSIFSTMRSQCDNFSCSYRCITPPSPML
jgi:hypothetical protein